MNRKQFIESHGATCQNWRNMAWSFINEDKKMVIFGAFNHEMNSRRLDNAQLILADSWSHYDNDRKAHGYEPSCEYLEKVLWSGYSLYTFPQKYKLGNPESGSAVVADEDFSKAKLTQMALLREGEHWFAVPINKGNSNS